METRKIGENENIDSEAQIPSRKSCISTTVQEEQNQPVCGAFLSHFWILLKSQKETGDISNFECRGANC
jgi:hypothetical protein